jgi:hypothetical protein
MATMTRREVKALEYNKPLPAVLNGRSKGYEEVFINAGGEPTEEMAQSHLVAIVVNHPRKLGWYSQNGHEGVFQDEDGLWYAFRHQAQYR